MTHRTCLLVAGGFVVLSSACGPGGGSTTPTDDGTAGPSPTSAAPSVPAPEASATTTTPTPAPTPTAMSTATPTAPPTTTDTDACRPGTAPHSDEAAARCLYGAFRDADRDRASAWATPAALDDLFALGGYPTDDAWSFEGCGAPLETTPSSGVSCRFTIPGEVHGVTVEMALRDDHVVEAVQSIG